MAKKILVIEDDSKVRQGLKLILEMNGFQVILAQNGSEGVMFAKKSMPDLILCDVMMPGMDGYQVIEILSSEPKTEIIPFLFLTAKVEVTDIRNGLKLGADDYLLKPIKENELINAINTRLRKISKIKESVKTADSTAALNDNFEILNIKSKFMVTIGNNSKLIPVESISFIEANNQYSKVWLKSLNSILVKKSLSAWEKSLPSNIFIRIHRSTIVNLEQIDKLTKWSSNTMKVYVKDYKEPIFISQRYLKIVKSQLHSV